jgi:hypothetical protein
VDSLTIGLQDVANLVVFIAPGYFAGRTYSAVHSKSDKDFSRILLESAVFSLPIVSVYDLIWQQLSDQTAVSTSVWYVLPLLLVSFAVGLGAAKVRGAKWSRPIARQLGFPGADEDFMRAQFHKLAGDEAVTVRLKSGSFFSGTPQGGNSYKSGTRRQYFFNNVAWYNNEAKNASTQWEERPGSLIIDLDEVMYIETAKSLPRD